MASLKRDTLLDTAERLFYAEGFHATGIDRVINEAGVARMTLYNHFASKEALIEAVLERPRSGREVAEQTDMSRSTAFRRLNTLVDLNLVETEQRIDATDGHHRKQYRAIVESFSVRFGDGGLDIVIESEESTGFPRSIPRSIPASD